MSFARPLKAFLLLAAVWSASCASYVEGRVESVLLAALPRVVGPADRYEATVRGVDATASHVDEVHAVGIRVQRPRTPVIDRFEVELQDVSIDRASRQVTGIGAARAVVRVKPDDLTAYLAQQAWIARPSVRLRPPDRLEIGGFLQVPGMPFSGAAASFVGRLVADGPRLRVVVGSLELAGREAPPLLRSMAEAAINPLFDLSSYAVPSTIDRVDVQDEAIVVEASGSRVQVQRRP